MKFSSLVALAFLAFGCSDTANHDLHGADSPEANATHAEGAADWITLFDGTSLDAFRGFNREDVPAAWTIQDGTLAFTPGGDDGGDIMTRDQFESFELTLEWKISEGGNSGIIYRATEEFSAPWMTGPEYQVLDNLAHPDANAGDDRKAGANYDMEHLAPDAAKAVGDWNEARIVAHGTHVQHWLNGQLTSEYELYSQAWADQVAASKWAGYDDYGQRLRGHIALQDHGDAVWYRNVRLRSLDTD